MTLRVGIVIALALALPLGSSACSVENASPAKSTASPIIAAPTVTPSATTSRAAIGPKTPVTTKVIVSNPYPWHRKIVATTFWVGEIFDPNAEDGSQVISTYDSRWLTHYGGCDGIVRNGDCATQKRTAKNNYFPTAMSPKQNPFYLDLPFDDVNDSAAFARRSQVIPWADAARYAKDVGDDSVSLMKNRWVEIRKGSRRCFGQVEDAGPGQYNDAAYVFGKTDRRPKNKRYGGAGMDVSPALNGCLGFAELDGDGDRVSWRFVAASKVPAGPWKRIITRSGVS